MDETRVRSSRVLIVDDLIANASLLENVLNRVGYKQLRLVTDARAALASVEEWKPELVILDVGMPRLEGYAIMDRLRQTVPKDSWIPILVLTANADPATKRRALAAGATEFLSKPFDSSEIVLRLRNLLVMRHLHADLKEENFLLEERVAARTKSLSRRTEELEHVLAEVKKAQNQAVKQERFRAFGEMAGGVAHDFNNVLQCVIGYTDLMLDQPEILQEPGTAVTFLQMMNTAGHDASKVVARLRDFYRPREQSEVFTTADLNELLQEAIPLTRPKWHTQALATGRNVDVRLDLEAVPPVSCNASELRQLTINLIFNAVDAMPEGGSITIRTRETADGVKFGVSDCGTGMSEEVRSRCMEPFFSTKGCDGTGLGLSMVFGIVKRHEGTVEIETELGKGTTFWVSLPSLKGGPEAADIETVGQVEPMHVLAVDDESVSADVISRYLRADGHSVVSVGTAIEALEKLQSGRFDLVITDQAMPGMTGMQLAERIGDSPGAPPVILLSGFSDPRLGASEKPPCIAAIVTKPLSQKRLRQAIAGIIARHRPGTVKEPGTVS